METKICKKCLEEKKISEFSKMKRAKDGLQSWCKLCNKDYNSRMILNRGSAYSKGYPTPHDKCVYCIKNTEDMIVYVGSSKNTSYRLWEHLSGKKSGSLQFHKGDIPDDLDKYSYEIIWHGDNDMKRKITEKVMIDKHQPKFNKQYKHG